MNESISQKIIELAAKHAEVPAEKVTSEDHFVNDLNYDSLTKVEFAMSVEDEFKVTVPDERLEEFQTVGNVIEFVKNNVRS